MSFGTQSTREINAIAKQARALHGAGDTAGAMSLLQAAILSPRYSVGVHGLRRLLTLLSTPQHARPADTLKDDHMAILDEELGIYALVLVPTVGDFDAVHVAYASANEQRGGALACQMLVGEGLDEAENRLVERGLRRVEPEHFHPAFRLL